MELPKNADIIIIGGGVMGASTLYHLTQRGYRNIILLEKESFFGQGATGRCAGGVRYQFATEVNIRLSLASLPMLENFEAEFDQKIDYRKCGYLFLLNNENDIKTFRQSLILQNMLGVNTQWLNGDDIRTHLPMMNLDDVMAGTYNALDGLVDPNSVVMGYLKAAQRLGAHSISDVPVIGITVKSGRVTGVNTPFGAISTGIIVNATGPWAGDVSKMAGVDVPVRPLRRQWLVTTPIAIIPADFPFVIDFAQSLYFHREGSGLLTGMSNPYEKYGFDQNIDPDWELKHMEAAVHRMPILEDAGVASRLAGLYEVTPDSHPIYGETPVVGLYIVTGFSGHGFMHGPISGKLMSEIILDGHSQTVDVSMLDLARFSEGRLIQEYNVV